MTATAEGELPEDGVTEIEVDVKLTTKKVLSRMNKAGAECLFVCADCARGQRAEG